MALTGHLSDLSLSELIEFFCNQRKTGRLEVHYPQGPGCFHLHSGSVVDAKIGVLRGIDAVYYALTLHSAAFEFKSAAAATERTINQPWTQVVLEGLRRLDEGKVPPEAFPERFLAASVDHKSDAWAVSGSTARISQVPSFLSMMGQESIGRRRSLVAGAVAVAVLASVAAIGVPAGWYGRSKAAPTQPSSPVSSGSPAAAVSDSQTAKPGAVETDSRATDAAALAARRQREREKAKAREERADAAAGNESPTPPTSPAPQTAANDVASKPGPRKATVQVTYDESGRVVQASGADATALRIARQKRFPPGKAGTATITIPIN